MNNPFSYQSRSRQLPALLSSIGLLLTVSLAPQLRADSASPTLPFKVEVKEVEKPTLPGVHSFTSSTADGKWLIIGGRIAGLHGFGSGNNNFPRPTANTTAYVIDPAAKKDQVLGSIDLITTLPKELAGPLTATNQEFAQVGNDLYILGGYGTDLQNGGLTTFGSLIKIDVAKLIAAITTKADNTTIKACFTQSPASDNRLKVTGGGLRVSNNVFYLTFGQDFTGFYSVQNRDYNRAGGQFQKYTEKIRVFTLNADLSINQFTQIDGGYDDTLPYHRRDLNVVDIIDSDGQTPAATVYGGVFRAGQVAGHTTPIDITFSTTAPTATVLSSFKQALSQYDCANFTVYDSASTSSYTTLFGGISQFHYDSTNKKLILDQVDLEKGIDGLPFIDTVSTIQHGPNGALVQVIQPTPLPALVGTDAQFLASPGLAKNAQVFPNGVIDLSKLSEATLVGHIVGGIESFGPYSGLVKQDPSTVASKHLFEVWVTPGKTPVLPMPPLPTQATPYTPPPAK